MNFKQYKIWAIVNNENMFLTEENHTTSKGAIAEMLQKGYTLDEMRKNGFSCCHFLCENGCWIECLEEIKF